MTVQLVVTIILNISDKLFRIVVFREPRSAVGFCLFEILMLFGSSEFQIT